MNLFEWGTISTGVYVALIIAGICMYIVIFHLEKVLGEKKKNLFLKNIEQCIIGCDSTSNKNCKLINNLRDKDYYYFSKSEKCVISLWEITHFITHVFIGYFTNIYISQGISIGFELHEHYNLNCGSYLDLGYNLCGFLVGHYLKNIINT
jgi:hypothetical protein